MEKVPLMPAGSIILYIVIWWRDFNLKDKYLLIRNYYLCQPKLFII